MKAASVRIFTAYGPRENETHAIIALIAKAFIQMDPYVIWGTGKQERNFTYVQDTTNTPSVAYTLNADPSMRGLTGQQSYFIDQTDVIRYNSTTTASASDNPL